MTRRRRTSVFPLRFLWLLITLALIGLIMFRSVPTEPEPVPTDTQPPSTAPSATTVPTTAPTETTPPTTIPTETSVPETEPPTIEPTEPPEPVWEYNPSLPHEPEFAGILL